ncbi:hypothetical protein G6F43_001464 [Rhizopus delemar]|nr:hypothetical protein G6F43_001464 [Rhizopus delemar]
MKIRGLWSMELQPQVETVVDSDASFQITMASLRTFEGAQRSSLFVRFQAQEVLLCSLLPEKNEQQILNFTRLAGEIITLYSNGNNQDSDIESEAESIDIRAKPSNSTRKSSIKETKEANDIVSFLHSANYVSSSDESSVIELYSDEYASDESSNTIQIDSGSEDEKLISTNHSIEDALAAIGLSLDQMKSTKNANINTLSNTDDKNRSYAIDNTSERQIRNTEVTEPDTSAKVIDKNPSPSATSIPKNQAKTTEAVKHNISKEVKNKEVSPLAINAANKQTEVTQNTKSTNKTSSSFSETKKKSAKAMKPNISGEIAKKGPLSAKKQTKATKISKNNAIETKSSKQPSSIETSTNQIEIIKIENPNTSTNVTRKRSSPSIDVNVKKIKLTECTNHDALTGTKHELSSSELPKPNNNKSKSMKRKLKKKNRRKDTKEAVKEDKTKKTVKKSHKKKKSNKHENSQKQVGQTQDKKLNKN